MIQRVFEDNFTAWCLAMALELDVDLGEPGPAYGELADAMLVWADNDEVESLSARVLDVVWTPLLGAAIRHALEQLGRVNPGWRSEARVGLADLERRGRASEIALAVIQRLALQDAQEEHDPFLCLCCAEEAIEGRPAEERRLRALSVAEIARPDAGVPAGEVRAALRRVLAAGGEDGDRRLARELASAERREAVRRRMSRIARLGRESMPALSAELVSLLGDGPPDDPAADALWQAVCLALVRDLDLELN